MGRGTGSGRYHETRLVCSGVDLRTLLMFVVLAPVMVSTFPFFFFFKFFFFFQN